MHVLCDTCCVLMLIRIAPSMFSDPRFGCFTVGSVREEFVQTQKFKERYPWRKEYAKYIKHVARSHPRYEDVELYFKVINVKTRNGVVNKLKDELFDLSRVDQRLLAWSLAMELPICTSDDDISKFGHQEFREVFKGHASPLAIVNSWIDKKVIQWTERLSVYLGEWKSNHEPIQPTRQKRRFRQLTGYKYPGS